MEVPRIGSSSKTWTPNKNCSIFTKAKSKLTEKVPPFLKKIKNTNKNVKIVFCKKRFENKTLQNNCAKKIEEINFGFTSPVTPHKNGAIERDLLQIMYGCAG